MAAKHATFSWRCLVPAALLIIYGYTLTQGQNVIIGTDIKEFECDFGNASQDLSGSVQIGQPEIAACNITGQPWRRSYTFFPNRFSLLDDETLLINGGGIATSKCHEKVMVPNVTDCPDALSAVLRSPEWKPSLCTEIRLTFWLRFSHPPNVTRDPATRYFLQVMLQYSDSTHRPTRQIWGTKTDYQKIVDVTVWNQVIVEFDIGERFTLNYLAHHNQRICDINPPWNISVDTISAETVGLGSSCSKDLRRQASRHQPDFCKLDFYLEDENGVRPTDFVDQDLGSCTKSVDHSQSCDYPACFQWAPLHDGNVLRLNCDFDHEAQTSTDGTLDACGRSVDGDVWHRSHPSYPLRFEIIKSQDQAVSQFAQSRCYQENPSSMTFPEKMTAHLRSMRYYPSSCRIFQTSFWYRRYQNGAVPYRSSSLPVLGVAVSDLADEYFLEVIVQTDPVLERRIWVSPANQTNDPVVWVQACVEYNVNEPFTLNFLAHHSSCLHNDSTIDLDDIRTVVAVELVCTTTSLAITTEAVSNTDEPVTSSHTTTATEERSSTTIPNEEHTSTAPPGTNTPLDNSSSHSTRGIEEGSSTPNELTTSTASTEPGTSTLTAITSSDSTIIPGESSSTTTANERTTSTASTEPGTSTSSDATSSISTIAPEGSSSTTFPNEVTTSTASTEPGTSTLTAITSSDSTIPPEESSSTITHNEGTTSTTSTEPHPSTSSDITSTDSSIALEESSSTTTANERTTSTASTEPGTSTLYDITSSDSSIALEESSSTTTANERTTSTASTEPGTSTLYDIASSDSTISPDEFSSTPNEETISIATTTAPGTSTSSDITSSTYTTAPEGSSSTTFPNEMTTNTASNEPGVSTPSDTSSSEYITATEEISNTNTASTEPVPGTSATGEEKTTLLTTSHTAETTTNSISANASLCDGDLSCGLAWMALEPVTARKLACNFGSSQPSVTQGVYWCPGWERRAPWLRFQFDVANHPSDRRNFFAISQCSTGSNAYFQNATAILRTPAVQPAECSTYNLTFRYQLSGPPSFSDSYYLDVRIGKPEETAVPSKVLWGTFSDYEGVSLSGDRWNSASAVFSASESFIISFVAHHNDRCSPQNRQTVAIDDIATAQARKCTTTTQTAAVTPAMPLCSFPACFDWVPLEAPELLSLNCNFGHYQPAASQGVYWCRNWERKFSWLRYQFDIVRSDPDKTYAQSNCSVGTWSADSFPAKAVLRTPVVFTRECTTYHMTFRYRLASAPVFNEGEIRSYYLDVRIGIKDEYRIPNRIIWSTPSDFLQFNAVNQWTDAVAVFDVAGNESFHVNFVAHHGSQCSSNRQAISVDDIVTRKAKERTCTSSTMTPAIQVTTEAVPTVSGYDDTTETTLVTATQFSRTTATGSTQTHVTKTSANTATSVTAPVSESMETTVSVAVLNADTTAVLVIPATTPSTCPLHTCTETIALPATLATKLNCNFGTYQPPGVEGVYWCPKWERKHKQLRYQFDIVQQGSQNAQAVSQCSVGTATTNTNSYKAILRTPVVQAPECTVFFLTFWYMMSGTPHENFYLDVRMGDADETQVPSTVIWEMDYSGFRPNERISASVRYEVPQHQTFVINFVAHHHSKCATAKETIVIDDIRTQQVVNKKNFGQ